MNNFCGGLGDLFYAELIIQFSLRSTALFNHFRDITKMVRNQLSSGFA